MRKFVFIFCTTTLVLSACNNQQQTEQTQAGEKTTADTNTAVVDVKKETPPMPDSATMQKNFQAFMTPGAMHKMMAAWNGTWNGEVTMWMAPGAPEEKSKTVAVNKMVMNGLYEESIHTGNMMGMPFNGKSTMGYDNHRKEFVNTWIDNMGSGIMVLRGPWDEGTKTMNLKGKSTDPATMAEVEMRETFKVVDDNTQVMDMFVMMPNGTEFKTMSIKFTRKK